LLAQFSMASPTKLDSLTNKFNKRRDQAWRSHMGTATRMRLSVTARMGSSEAVKVKMYSACFHAEGPPPMCSDTSVMKRFPADRPLAALQDEVAAAFDWGDSALFYHADTYGNMRPVSTHEELCKACEHWEGAVGERKIKQLADLLLSVEDQLNTSNDHEVQLAGAMAAWELACDKSHHDRIPDDFLLALQSALVSDDFAVACHASAALHMLRRDPTMCQAFGTRVVGGLARALRMTLAPPDTVPEVCPEPIVRLCRLPVLAMHAMLDPIDGRPPREVALGLGLGSCLGFGFGSGLGLGSGSGLGLIQTQTLSPSPSQTLTRWRWPSASSRSSRCCGSCTSRRCARWLGLGLGSGVYFEAVRTLVRVRVRVRGLLRGGAHAG
jgi:hypothetical protein